MVADRRCDHPTQESLECDLADTRRSLAAEETLATKLVESCGDQPSKWEEGEKSSRVELQVHQSLVAEGRRARGELDRSSRTSSDSASNLMLISLDSSDESVEFLKTISMIDEMVTLPKGEQGENDEKKTYSIKRRRTRIRR